MTKIIEMEVKHSPQLTKIEDSYKNKKVVQKKNLERKSMDTENNHSTSIIKEKKATKKKATKKKTTQNVTRMVWTETKVCWMFNQTLLNETIKVRHQQVDYTSLTKRLGCREPSKMLENYELCISAWEASHISTNPDINIASIRRILPNGKQTKENNWILTDIGACCFIHFYVTALSIAKKNDHIVADLVAHGGIETLINNIPGTRGFKFIIQQWGKDHERYAFIRNTRHSNASRHINEEF